MGVTIKQVAKAAGVSSAAVSKVLHGRGSNIRVSAHRAEEIRRVAKDLNYVPNALARGLRVNRTHTIGLLFENFAGLASGPLYIVNLLDGVAKTIFPHHYRLTILSELDHDNVIGALADGHLDGVIWCKFNRDLEVLEQIRSCPIPIVSMNRVPDEMTPFVACDNGQGIRLAVQHLVDLGHREIAFVNEVEEEASPDCQERRDAYLRAMEGHGLTPQTFSWSWHLPEFLEHRANGGRETAILAWSERCAAQLLIRAAEAGISVPTELSIVGFDSTDFCETTKPRLTAVRQPIQEMSASAATKLLHLIEGVALDPVSTTFPCTLDVRESTARPLKAEESP